MLIWVLMNSRHRKRIAAIRGYAMDLNVYA
jgi:hypothetical protein